MRERCVQPEVMDDPALPAAQHALALRGLARLNRWSRAAAVLWRPIRSGAASKQGKPVRVLDLACGGGDVAIDLERRARRDRSNLVLEGCDVSACAVEYATTQAHRAGAAIRFFQHDVLRDPMPADYDILMCSLFLHHLAAADLKDFLQSLAASTRHMVVLSDLVRSRRGLALARLATQALSRSPVVHVDGPRSVRAALSLDEVRQFAAEAGMHGAVIRQVWPMRYLLVWRRM